jgi:aminopeptidase N
MNTCFRVAVASLFPLFLYGQQLLQPTEHFTRERTYDVLHYKLNLAVDLKEKSCTGSATITLVPLRTQLDTVMLDAAELSIGQVTVGRKVLDFRLAGETLFVGLDKPYGLHDTLNLTVAYSVSNPKKGLYFITPDSGYPLRQRQVWSQGEAEDNHFWFPCYDFPNDKATSEMIVTVDDRYTAISNGKLLEVKRDEKHHTATFHWMESKPHVSYLVSLVVGEYVSVKDSWGTLPIFNYVYRHQQDDAEQSFGKTAKMLDFFSNKIGYRYPWEKYGHAVVEDFMYSGEENVSISTLTDRTIRDARAHLDGSSDELVAHELAHQWWGDLVSFRDWSHAWLSEGFATYFEALFQEYDKGKDVFAKKLADAQRTVANADFRGNRRPTVCNRFVSPNDIFDNRIYQKGACVLHMLRFTLGDELFWKAINHYVEKYAFQNAETNDFKIAIEEATGYNLQWFFDQWLYKAGYPEFDVQSKWDQETRNVQVTVKQTQKIDSLTGIFATPVDIEVWVHDVPQTYRVMITKREETFSFPAYQQPQLVLFDKGSWLLKKVNFQKSFDELIYQLKHAEAGVDRLAAIEELQWGIDSSTVIAAIEQAMTDDAFSDVRKDAVWALGDVKKRDVSEQLIEAYGDRDAKIRAAAVTSLSRYSSENIVKTLQHAFEKDSSYAVATAALQSLIKADSTNRKVYCKAGLKRNSYLESIRSAALQGLAEVADDEALALVVSYTKYGVDRNLRIQAVRLLGSVWKTRDDIVQFLLKMSNDPSYHVRRSVIETLGNIGNPLAREPIQKILERETDSRLAKVEREALEKIQPAH